MKKEEILEMWKEDAILDEFNIEKDVREIPKLHTKYLTIYSKEYDMYVEIKSKYNETKKRKFEYYLGYLPEEDMKKYNYVPLQKKLLKADVTDIYLKTDDEILLFEKAMMIQENKLKVLEMILEHIKNRNFLIKNLIDEQKFISGE